MHLVVYTDAAERGGAESVLGRLLARLRDDVRVTVVGPHEEVVRWLAAQRPGGRYGVLPAIAGRNDVRNMWRHRRAFRRLRPDVIHFNLSTMSSCQWAIVAAITIPRVRFVVMEHAPMGTWSGLSNRLKRLTSARADAHVAVGRRAAAIIEELGALPPGSVEVIPNGMPVAQVDPPTDHEDLVVGMLARHDPVKGVDLAVRTMAELGAGFRLVVIGDGRERPALEALVRELGVEDRVELRGWDDQARRRLGGFDVYLLPSRLEAFPVTIMEAMQAGVPVVATDVGSVREAIDDGETGLVVPVEDVAAMAAAIRSLRDDPERRRAMGERARAVALERFDVDTWVHRWETLYDEVADGRHRRP